MRLKRSPRPPAINATPANRALFRLLGGGGMGDMGKPLSASRLAILPATSHTAVITQVDLLHGFIEPFLKGKTPNGFFEP